MLNHAIKEPDIEKSDSKEPEKIKTVRTRILVIPPPVEYDDEDYELISDDE